MHDLTRLDQLISGIKLIPARPNGYLAGIFRTADSTIDMNIGAGETLNCLVKVAAPGTATILYFHDPVIADTNKITATAAGFTDSQINFIAAEYCTSPATCGCSFAELCNRADLLVPAVKEWLDEQSANTSLFLMGESIGGVIALGTAVENPEQVKGLILDSLINETAPFLEGLTGKPCEITEEDGFGCLKMLTDYTSPTLFYHGAKDQLVSTRDAEKLQSYSGARTKQFYVIPGGERGNLEAAGGKLYFETIRKFFDTVCGTNTWREKRKKFKAGSA